MSSKQKNPMYQPSVKLVPKPVQAPREPKELSILMRKVFQCLDAGAHSPSQCMMAAMILARAKIIPENIENFIKTSASANFLQGQDRQKLLALLTGLRTSGYDVRLELTNYVKSIWVPKTPAPKTSLKPGSSGKARS